MPTIKVTDATILPISLDEAKAHMGVDDNDQDDLIEMLIHAAREEAEKKAERSVVPTVWANYLDAFPPLSIRLYWPRVTEVAHVKYYDTAGVLQTLDSNAYQLDAVSEPARLVPAPGTCWPATQARLNAVEVQYTAGWPSAESVPHVLKAWLKLRVATLFENRELLAIGVSVAEIPQANSLLDGHSLWNL